MEKIWVRMEHWSGGCEERFFTENEKSSMIELVVEKLKNGWIVTCMKMMMV